MEEKPKEEPKEKMHKSGLVSPTPSQQPHHPPTIEPDIVEFDQPTNEDRFEDVKQLPEEADQDPVDEKLYERRS